MIIRKERKYENESEMCVCVCVQQIERVQADILDQKIVSEIHQMSTKYIDKSNIWQTLTLDTVFNTSHTHTHTETLYMVDTLDTL